MTVPLPTFSLTRIFDLRQVLHEQVALYWVGKNLDAESLGELSRDLKEKMPAQVSKEAIFESLSYLLGHYLTVDKLKDVCWRLAGNVPRLKEGRTVPVWQYQEGLEWVPVQITRYDPSRNRYNEYQHKYTMRVLAGSPAPMTITAYWSKRFVPLVASYVGFGRKYSKYPYTNAAQLASLRLCVLLDPAVSYDDGPGFREVQCPGSFKEYNRSILKLRLRVGAACPQGFTHACHKCSVGADNCPAATHSSSYTTSFCQVCRKNSYFDPEIVGDTCISCHNKKLVRPRDA